MDPLEAELVVSGFLGSMRGADPAHPAVSTDSLDGLIKSLTSRTTPEATAAVVDFSHLGGWCPDLMVTADPDALHGAMAQDAATSEGLARFAPLDPVAACFLVVRALTATDMTHQPDVAASFGDTIALALARLRLVSTSVGARADDAVVVGVEPDSVDYLARVLVDYGFDYDNGRPLRVSPTKLGNFLLRRLPRKVTLDADDRPGRCSRGIDDLSSVEELQEMVSERVTEQNAELAAGWTYSVRAEVAYTSPPIWRRLALPGGTTLGQLHDVLQSSFGWDDGHLHVFTVRDTQYSSFDACFDDSTEDEDWVTLRQVVKRTGQKFTYLYDFGDSWEIQLKVEKIDRTGSGPVAVCTDGRRGGPFEDSGGIGGYEGMCAVLADPDHPEHAEVAEWVGFEPGAVTFDPAAFDQSALNRVLAELPVG